MAHGLHLYALTKDDMMRNIFAMLTMVLALGCANPNPDDLPESSDENGSCFSVSYGQAFTVTEMQRYCFDDGVSFTVLNIVDALCKDICVWEGNVVLKSEWLNVAAQPVNHEHVTTLPTEMQNIPLPNGSVVSDQGVNGAVTEMRITVSAPSP